MSAEVPIIDMTATGERIKQLREDKGLTIKELQDTFGFTNPQAIYKWQKGVNIPTVDNLVILSSILGVPMDEIIVTS